MLLLTDVYCLVNRARGTQLISPFDCLTACSLFASVSEITFRLKEFDSGVKAIVADGRTEQHIAARIKTLLQEEERAVATGNSQQIAPATANVAAESGVLPWSVCHPYVSISPLRLSNLWHISIVLAKQYLCVAEQLSVVCRDEAPQGLNFALNHFNEW